VRGRLRIGPSFEQERAITCIPAKREDAVPAFFANREKRAEPFVAGLQDDPEKGVLQEWAAGKADDPLGESVGVEFDGLDDRKQDARDIVLADNTGVEGLCVEVFFYCEIIDVGPPLGKPQPDADEFAVADAKLEQTQVWKGMQADEGSM
jgi:hypothetical protein